MKTIIIVKGDEAKYGNIQQISKEIKVSANTLSRWIASGLKFKFYNNWFIYLKSEKL